MPVTVNVHPIRSSLRRLATHPVLDGVVAGASLVEATQQHGLAEVACLVIGSASAILGTVNHLYVRSRAVQAENRLRLIQNGARPGIF